MSFTSADLVVLVFLVSSSLSDIPSTSILWAFLNPEGEEFDGDIQLRAKCFKISHFLHIVWQWAPVFVPILGRKFL